MKTVSVPLSYLQAIAEFVAPHNDIRPMLRCVRLEGGRLYASNDRVLGSLPVDDADGTAVTYIDPKSISALAKFVPARQRKTAWVDVCIPPNEAAMLNYGGTVVSAGAADLLGAPCVNFARIIPESVSGLGNPALPWLNMGAFWRAAGHLVARPRQDIRFLVEPNGDYNSARVTIIDVPAFIGVAMPCRV